MGLLIQNGLSSAPENQNYNMVEEEEKKGEPVRRISTMEPKDHTASEYIRKNEIIQEANESE